MITDLTDTTVYVATVGNILFTDQGDDNAFLYLFETENQAVEYIGVCEPIENSALKVSKISTKELWGKLPNINKLCNEQLGLPLEVYYVNEEDDDEADLIWSASEKLN